MNKIRSTLANVASHNDSSTATLVSFRARFFGAMFFSFIITFLLGCTNCATAPKTAVRLEVTDTEVRAVAEDGSVLKTLILGHETDKHRNAEGIEIITRRNSRVFWKDGVRIALLEHTQVVPGGDLEREWRQNTLTFYNKSLDPIWSTNQVGDDPGGFGVSPSLKVSDDGSRVIAFATLGDIFFGETEEEQSPYIIARNADGKVIFEHRCGKGYQGGVAFSNNARFIAYGEYADNSIAVIDLISGKQQKTGTPPEGWDWNAGSLTVSDDGQISTVIEPDEGGDSRDWQEKLSW